MPNTEAYDEGYDAYWDGVAHEDSPYDPVKEPEKRRSWDEGWRAARKHDYDEKDG